MMSCRSFVLLVALAGAPAFAQEGVSGAGQAWSIVGAKTLETNGNAIDVAAGWPGLLVSYHRGVAPMLTLGARGGFVYGVEGMVRAVAPGFKVQALLRVRLLERDRISLGLTFEPGPFFHSGYFASTMWGFSIPVGFRLGIVAASALSLAVLLDLPLWVQFGSGGGVNVPILTGVGLEYFVTSSLLVYFRTRMGPTIRPYNVAEFTFEGVLGVGFRL